MLFILLLNLSQLCPLGALSVDYCISLFLCLIIVCMCVCVIALTNSGKKTARILLHDAEEDTKAQKI